MKTNYVLYVFTFLAIALKPWALEVSAPERNGLPELASLRRTIDAQISLLNSTLVSIAECGKKAAIYAPGNPLAQSDKCLDINDAFSI
jgi:hypothetical protein